MSDFTDLGLSKNALHAVEKLGYEKPTPVQEQSIPLVLDGADVIAAASTGTGKTAAFLLPTLDKLESSRKRARAPRVLVITPTRELAQQIAHTAIKICHATKHFATVVYGGTSYSKQIKELKGGTDLLVATPGRLCDLLDRGAVKLDHIETLILDEADRMLDMGFLPDVTRIVEKIPEERQTLLFSATIDRSIKDNLGSLLKDPEIVQIAHKGQTAETIKQYIIPVSQKQKPELLKALLDEKGYDRVVVFARTKARAEEVAAMLNEADFGAECIHSNRTQGQRRQALQNFRNGRSGIIVATDVLARGIDVPSVDYVVNYDLPDMEEDYIHRIGRTGRAGEEGFAVSFVSANSVKLLKSIEALVNKQIPVMRLKTFDIDESILHKVSGKKKKMSARDAERARRHKESKYDYTGWSDMRKGKKHGAGTSSSKNGEGKNSRGNKSKRGYDAKPKGPNSPGRKSSSLRGAQDGGYQTKGERKNTGRKSARKKNR
jgi:ATP-dependent RNA helicase RhlE